MKSDLLVKMNSAEVTLICLPFAGGNKYSYLELFKYLPANVRPITLEPPGRGERVRENLLSDMYAMSEDLLLKVVDQVSQPYAIFGHSMGAILAYLLTQQIRKANLPLPIHLFASGNAGPSYKRASKYSLLTKDRLKQKLIELGGSPEELLEDDSLFQFFESIIRADFHAVETFQYRKSVPFNIPISVMMGEEDKYTVEDAELWLRESSHPVDIQLYPGGHFFLFEHREKVCKYIEQKLLPISAINYEV